MFGAGKISLETLWCLSMVDELCKKIRNGLLPFSKCTVENKDYCLFYYEQDGKYKLVMDMCVDGTLHHDIISNYDEYCGQDQCEVNVIDIEGNDYPHIEISFPDDDSTLVIGIDGRWYMEV